MQRTYHKQQNKNLTDSTSLNLVHLSNSSEWVLVQDRIVWGAESGGVSACGSSTCGLAVLGGLGTCLGDLETAWGADLAGRSDMLLGATTGGK